MSSILEQFLLLPVTLPGNLAYHAILAFTIFGALQGALNNRQAADGRAGRRMATGLIAMLCLQILLFVITGLAWQGLIGGETWLPVMDRITGLLSLLIITWLWAYPKTRRLADAFATLIGLGLVALAVYALVWWQAQDPAEAGRYFNRSAADVIGGGIALALALLGIFIIVIRRTSLWGFGLVMLLGLSAGTIVHWLAPLTENDFSGALRLAEMAFYPLLLALPQRQFGASLGAAASEQRLQAQERSFSNDAKAQQELLRLSLLTSPKQFYQELARSISQLLVGDICLLALPQANATSMIFAGGYNLIMDRWVDGFVLDFGQAPALCKAISENALLNLPASSTSPDRQSLARVLDLNQIGHLLATPVASAGSDTPPNLGIVLLTPYSNHAWSEADQTYLRDLVQVLAPILQRVQMNSQHQEQVEHTRQRLEALDGDATRAVSENSQLISRLEDLQVKFAQEKQRSESLAALVTEHSALQETIARLEKRNRELEALVKLKPDGNQDETEYEMRLLLSEMASLRQSLAEADRQLIELRSASETGHADAWAEDHEVITSIAQELRQPMASIVGYTDLLLGESVGLLGAMQRKFLERVKASSERMGGLLEDLIQVTTLDAGKMSLNPVMVDLNAVIDNAVSGMIAQLSEKNIALRVDLPDELPPIQADVEALGQILSNLLHNASMATPVDGEISLRARIEVKENEPSYLLLQVTDQGGGIPSEDLPRVFSRLYRADNALIQGIGETGVGLSVVKTLVEAHGGRIWVDTIPGSGSSFSVLLPVIESVPETDRGDVPA